MLDKDIKKAIDKRKQYLDSQKVFKSPRKVQWDIYRNQRVERGRLLDDTDLEIVCGTLGILGLSSLSVGIVLVILAKFMFGFLGILVGGLLIGLTILITKGLPTQDNKFISLGDSAFDISRLTKYSKLHRLIYVKGEFYRVWYVRYVMGLDEKEFERTDTINSLLSGRHHRGTTYLHRGISYGIPYVEEVASEEEPDVDGGELERVRELLSDADRDREHWLNSLTTTRFLDYDEFMNILDTDKAVEEAKELDSRVSQFEEYMKHKSKIKKL
uniref:Uncharacterized protein n=1 Tax=Mammaliicoccus phage MSShimriz1 TaxID=3230127 RepID=A0AAU8GRM3_9VIRU